MNRLPLSWRPRAQPLPPCSALAQGTVAQALVRRLLACTGEQLARLRGLANAEYMLVTGEADDLPWVPGIRYLGQEPAAPQLWLPTHSEPDVPAALLAAALARNHPRTPIAVSPDPPVLLYVDTARPVETRRLTQWLHRHA